ncbi:MAG: hypothetical protein JNK04_24990 [Myxococcales bacterium]|nr:hypothetical protein [Myxococcales bacterium]
MSRLGLLAWVGFCLPVALSGCAYGAIGQAAVVDDKGESGVRSSFDRPIAVGAVVRPEIRYSLRGAGAPAMHYEVADESVLSAKDGVIRGKGAGLTSLLLVTDDGVVLDFFHLWVKEPTSVSLGQLTSDDKVIELDGRVDLMRGETLRLSASLRGEGQDLGGEAEQRWKMEGKAAQILEEGRAGRRRIVAVEPGKALLEVRVLDRIAKLEIEVHPPIDGAARSVKEVAR